MTPTRTTSTAFVLVKRSTRGGGVGCEWSSSASTSDNGIMSAIRYLWVGAHAAQNSRGWRDRAVVARWRESLRGVASAGAFSRNDGGRCREQDLDVCPERARPCVPEVETHHLVERRTAAAGDLPQSGNPGLYVEKAAAVPRLVLLELVGNRWPRADERHVSAQHVPELRQLVEAAVPEKASDRRDPWIVGELEDFGLTRLALAARIDEPRDVLLMELLVHVHVHRPKLENLERFHPLADAHLLEKYRAAGPQLHERGNEKEQRRAQQQVRVAPDDIELAL